VHFESEENYVLNDHVDRPDGGRYLICEVERGEPPTDIEVTRVWVDGPHPTTASG
jgi:hypothetical protein